MELNFNAWLGNKFHFCFLKVVCFSTFLSAQSIENNCLRVDFESINGTQSSPGLKISDQFIDAGVSFVLENGEFPVLANRGLPTEAFFSGFGPDNVGNQSLIGEYMLTDDGQVDGVDYSPLLIKFENPIDSISGYILDIDSDEEFEIIALDENDNLIYSQTIKSGEEQTGDGIATPWGFNLEGCFGQVYSVRFEGSRGSGDFGLAMDNFIFCFEGVDLLQNLETNVTDILCQDNPGAIEIINNSDSELQYSIDGGISFVEDGIFNNLNTGSYEIIVIDENGCEAILNEVVQATGPTVIEDLIITHTSCGLNNGSFEVFATQEQGVIYFIDAFNFQNQNTFENLSPGSYTVTVIGPTGCSASTDFEINPSYELFLEEPITQDDACQKTIGSIEPMFSGGTGTMNYSINGSMFQEEAFFDSLSMGEYIITYQDESFCTLIDTVHIGETPGLSIQNIRISETLCELPTGRIEFKVIGGTGDYQYQLDDGPFYSEPLFIELSQGEYLITAIDEIGCDIETKVNIPIPVCPIYIPNIFTPESIDGNNVFLLQTNSDQQVKILNYEIYDRWGSLIYTAKDFDIIENGFWWNGNKGSFLYPNGVYAYRILLEHFDGTQELIVGDITLIR